MCLNEHLIKCVPCLPCGRICTSAKAIHSLTGFEAGRWLWSRLEAGWPDLWLNLFADSLRNRKISWRLGCERERCHTAQVYMCVTIALQSWCLIKLSCGLLSPELWLSTRNSQQWHLCEEWHEPAEYACFTVAIAVLDKVKLFAFFVVISFFNRTTNTAHPSYWEAMFLQHRPKSGASGLSSSVLAANV